MVLYKDKVVLRYKIIVLSKVVLDFHLNQDTVLLFLCLAPLHQKEFSLHSLHEVYSVQVYLLVTAYIRKTGSLFSIPNCPHRGKPAPQSISSLWLGQIIAQAHGYKGNVPLFPVKAHFTRSVISSWDFQHQATVS